MVDSNLARQFRRCVRYKNAARWQKPFLNPVRFVRNQLLRRSIPAHKLGEQRQVMAFHLNPFTIVNGEAISESIATYGVYEDALTEAFLRLVRPDRVVVNVGMHLGYFTALFAQQVGPGGQVHSFEPTPSTRKLSRANVSQFPQVTVHPFAVWSSERTMTFRDYGIECMGFNSFTGARIDNAPPPKFFEVETTTLDRFWETLNKPIALIKIDAESAERDILMGAVKLLASGRPVISLEVGDEGSAESRSRELIEMMQKLNYRAWEFQNGRFVVHSLRSRYTYDNLIFAPATQDLSSA